MEEFTWGIWNYSGKYASFQLCLPHIFELVLSMSEWEFISIWILFNPGLTVQKIVWFYLD